MREERSFERHHLVHNVLHWAIFIRKTHQNTKFMVDSQPGKWDDMVQREPYIPTEVFQTPNSIAMPKRHSVRGHVCAPGVSSLVVTIRLQCQKSPKQLSWGPLSA